MARIYLHTIAAGATDEELSDLFDVEMANLANSFLACYRYISNKSF
jgi:hypothetical protein